MYFAEKSRKDLEKTPTMPRQWVLGQAGVTPQEMKLRMLKSQLQALRTCFIAHPSLGSWFVAEGQEPQAPPAEDKAQPDATLVRFRLHSNSSQAPQGVQDSVKAP